MKFINTKNGSDVWANFDSGADFAKAMLKDGSLIVSYVNNPYSCNSIAGTSEALSNVCGWLGVDINGFKKPNQWGVDFLPLD